MSATPELSLISNSLISKIKMLSPQQMSEVEDFVEFLAAKAKKRSALDRLLAIVPALEAAGANLKTDDEIAADVNAMRAQSRAKRAEDSGADRS